MGEVAQKLARQELPCIDAEARVYFRDVADHVRRTQARVDGLREVLTGVFEFSSLMEQQRQGTITKQLAAWAAILAVPTAIAGIYGMNFDYMPELHAPIRLFRGRRGHRADLRPALSPLPQGWLALGQLSQLPFDQLDRRSDRLVDRHLACIEQVGVWRLGQGRSLPVGVARVACAYVDKDILQMRRHPSGQQLRNAPAGAHLGRRRHEQLGGSFRRNNRSDVAAIEHRARRLRCKMALTLQ